LLPRRRREHPDPRWHRLHLGASRAPVLQAGQELRAALRRPDLPPRAAGPAHRALIRKTDGAGGAAGARRPEPRGAGPPRTARYHPAMAVVFVLVTALAVVVIALVSVGGVTARLAAAPPRSLFDLHEAVAFVGHRLPAPRGGPP